MLDYIPLIGSILLTAIIVAGIVYMVRQNRDKIGSALQGRYHANGLSTCCAAPMEPLGWKQDGWVAECANCREWQYLGDDHDNPPVGFLPDGRPDPVYQATRRYARGGIVSGPGIKPGEVPSEHLISRHPAPRRAAKSPVLGMPYGAGTGDVDPEQPCTCPPDEAPAVCMRRYALSDCLAAASEIATDGRKHISAAETHADIPPGADPYGKVLPDGTISFRAGFAITHGIVAIDRDQLDLAREHGWQARDVARTGRIHMERTQQEYIANMRRLQAIPGWIGSEVTSGCDLCGGVLDHEADCPKGILIDMMPDQVQPTSTPEQLPPQPNIGGEGHPDYKGPHYGTPHETRYVPYDMIGDPIPGTAVSIAADGQGNDAIVGPLETERGNADPSREEDES